MSAFGIYLDPKESLALCGSCGVWHVVTMREHKEGERRPHPRADVRYAFRGTAGTGFGQTNAAMEDALR